MHKYEYELRELDCANCAAKIEHKLSKMDVFSEAVLNFMTRKLTVTTASESSRSEIDMLVKKTVTSIESDVIVLPWPTGRTKTRQSSSDADSCSCGHDHSHGDSCSHSEHKHGQEHTHDQEHEHSHGHDHDHGHIHGNTHANNQEQKQEDSNEHTHEKTSYRSLIPLGLGTVIAALGIIFPFSNLTFIKENAFLSSYLPIIIIAAGYLILSYSIWRTAFKNLLHGQIFDENFLALVATVGALIIGEYPEAIVVMLLFQIGEFFQSLAADHSRKQIAKTMSLKAEFANIETDDGLKRVDPTDVMTDEIIVVRPLESVPLDGIVLEGSSFVDTSSLTGESVPRKVEPGESILSGSVNGDNLLRVRVTGTYENSTVAKILELVENAAGRKSSAETFITKFARIYTPIVVLLAVLLAVLPPVINGSFDFIPWIYRACGFLVVSCPCALVISVPLGYFGGLGSSSKHGILVKGSNYLEALTAVKTVVFDKTGTLTKGVFRVTKLHLEANTGLDEQKFLLLAAAAEQFSTHPIASSIVAAYQNANPSVPLTAAAVSGHTELSGRGISTAVTLDGVTRQILIGNEKLLTEQGIAFAACRDNHTGSVVYAAADGVYAGYLLISDEIKEDAQSTISALNQSGIRTVMLSGDVKASVEITARDLGLSEYHGGLLPADKVAIVEEKKQQAAEQGSSKGKVVFLGDGMNDAPVLAMADIGIAMGGVGSDAAIEAADIVFMNDEPGKLLEAINIARHTKKIVMQNIVLALGIKALVLALLAVGYGSMWMAVFADVGVSLIAIFNSMRTLRK